MSTLLISLTIIIIPLTGYIITCLLTKSQFNPNKKHSYIGGGSEGLGLALACQLVQKGGNVSIVSRSELKLKDAIIEIEKFRISPDQIIKSYACDLTNSIESNKIFQSSLIPFDGKAPDYIFTCAGGCVPTLFEQMTAENHWNCMEWNFKTCLNTIHSGIAKMISQDVSDQPEKSKIVLTGSVLSMMGIIGYSAYSPSKFAIRGLAESLRTELLLQNIEVHLFLPSTIYSPGFEREQKLKPEITKKVEGPDEGMDCAGVATQLIKGLERNDFYITYEPVGSMLRNSRGITPRNDVLFDTLWGIAGTIALPAWRYFSADGEVHKEAKRLKSLKKVN